MGPHWGLLWGSSGDGFMPYFGLGGAYPTHLNGGGCAPRSRRILSLSAPGGTFPLTLDYIKSPLEQPWVRSHPTPTHIPGPLRGLPERARPLCDLPKRAPSLSPEEAAALLRSPEEGTSAFFGS